VPFVRPVTTQLLAGAVTVHVAPPGEAVTRYDVTAPPPEPAATVTVAEPLPASTPLIAGVAGAELPGVNGAEVAAAPQPAPDKADTDTVYVVPLVRPVRVHDVVEAGTRHEAPPGDATARYCVTANDPALAGADHVTVAEFAPEATDTDVGAEGATGAGPGFGPGVGAEPLGVTELEGPDDRELPKLFVATAVNVYAVPFVRPVTVQEPPDPVTVQLSPPGDDVTV